MKHELLELSHSFWNYHYTLTSKRSKRPLKLIGETRIDELMINHLLPNEIEHGNKEAWQSYCKFKPPVISEKVNRAAERLLGQRADKTDFLRKSWQHQALLQIYQDFCLEHTSGCDDCPFPERLKKWAEELN